MIHIPLLFAALVVQPTRFDTDTTVSVPQGARLRLQNQGGDVVIRAWDRSQMRIQANHSARASVEVDVRGQVVQLNTSGRRGFQSMVDYELTVPTWMAIDVGGMYAEISIDGVRAPIKANTLEGNITVRGGAETVQLTTVNGQIELTGARGRVELNATSGDVTVTDVQGELVIEAVSGDVDLRRIDARSVDVQSISGDLLYEGRIVDAGSYAFYTHSGDVTLAVGEGINATINLASASGEVSSSFSLRTERETRRRHVYRLGSGSATIDVETFNGDLNLIRPSELRARREPTAERQDERPRNRPNHSGWNDDRDHDEAQEN
jgi:hypothetical protein